MQTLATATFPSLLAPPPFSPFSSSSYKVQHLPSNIPPHTRVHLTNIYLPLSSGADMSSSPFVLFFLAVFFISPPSTDKIPSFVVFFLLILSLYIAIIPSFSSNR
ncbi:MAG: hypothetical protein J3R72DRAFT_47513 [Linnemannia gamsii]|nr:MAG: hypothetical protein J3R72DRAFT_47513 [Linnemannia gamsii]